MKKVDVPELKKMFIIRSAHHTPTSKPTDSNYDVVFRQLEVARRITGKLVEDQGVDHLFYDSMSQGEAWAWNTLLKASPEEYRRLIDDLWKKGFIKGEDQKDHLRWIEAIRKVRTKIDSQVEFHETEPKDKRDSAKDLVEPMLSIGVLPFKLQANFWLQQIAYSVWGRKMQNISGLHTFLRDTDAFPLIQKHTGASNALYVGRDHQCPDFYKRKSGFQVAGVTLEDDLTFEIDSANTGADMPETLSKLVRETIHNVLK